MPNGTLKLLKATLNKRASEQYRLNHESVLNVKLEINHIEHTAVQPTGWQQQQTRWLGWYGTE